MDNSNAKVIARPQVWLDEPVIHEAESRPIAELLPREPAEKLTLKDDISLNQVVNNVSKVRLYGRHRKDIASAVPQLVEYLHVDRRPDLQNEATLLLGDIASGTDDQLNAVVEAGTYPILIKFLESDHNGKAHAALKVLTNIAAGGVHLCSFLLGNGLLPVLVSLVNRDVSSLFLASLALCLRHLFSYESMPAEQPDSYLPAVNQLLIQKSNSISSDACWLLANVAVKGSCLCIQKMVGIGILHNLLEIIRWSDAKETLVPALTALVRISRQQAQAVVEHGALPALKRLISFDKVQAYVDAVILTLKNIIESGKGRIQEVINEGLLTYLVKVLQSTDATIRELASSTVRSLTSGSTGDQIQSLVEAGLIPVLVNIVISHPNSLLVLDAMIALNCIVDAVTGESAVKMLEESAEQSHLLDHLEKLKNHNESNVAVAADILHKNLQKSDDRYIRVRLNSAMQDTD